MDNLSLIRTQLFSNVTKSLGINYSHKDFDFIDFNVQSVLPHKFSEYCPALASADMDGNGLDDIVIGGTSLNPAQIFLQQENGSFVQKDLYNKNFGLTVTKMKAYYCLM